MKKTLLNSAVILGLVLSFEVYAGTAFVNQQTVFIYSQPDNNSSVASQAIYNTEVNILDSKSGYDLIQTPDNYQGWLEKAYLSTHSVYSNAHVAKVKNLFANIYQEPTTDVHPPLFTVPFDTHLTILKDQDDRWVKVQLADGKSGWIQHGEITIDEEPLSMSAMLESSRNFLGLPYLWGGTSTYGFDCSGFVQMLYKQIGVDLPRDGIDQAYLPGFTEVPINNLRPGDRLYFGWDNVISHAGIYLGNNKFINSTVYKNPGVQISDIRLPHWKDIFIVARRFDNAVPPVFEPTSGPIPDEVKQKMLQYTWHQGCPVSLDDLVYLELPYWGFDNKPHVGQMIVHKDVANDVMAIFAKLYKQKFPIEKMRLMDAYQGDDHLAMIDNNTSSFNCRVQTDFKDRFSAHSYGRAIDINPLYNPYVNGDKVDPKEGLDNADRRTYHKGKITDKTSIHDIFLTYHWTWGGDWPSKIKDYQHFEK